MTAARARAAAAAGDAASTRGDATTTGEAAANVIKEFNLHPLAVRRAGGCGGVDGDAAVGGGGGDRLIHARSVLPGGLVECFGRLDLDPPTAMAMAMASGEEIDGAARQPPPPPHAVRGSPSTLEVRMLSVSASDLPAATRALAHEVRALRPPLVLTRPISPLVVAIERRSSAGPIRRRRCDPRRQCRDRASRPSGPGGRADRRRRSTIDGSARRRSAERGSPPPPVSPPQAAARAPFVVRGGAVVLCAGTASALGAKRRAELAEALRAALPTFLVVFAFGEQARAVLSPSSFASARVVWRPIHRGAVSVVKRCVI